MRDGRVRLKAGHVRLKDGSSALIRPIVPQDRELLREGFERLSDRSRYLRFQTPTPQLSERQLAYLTEVDHHDHEALIAIDSSTGDARGVARFVRIRDDVAECAVVVGDEWQGRGLGTALLDHLVERARDEGVRRFTAIVLAENNEAIRLIERLGDSVQRSSGPQVELDVVLPETGGADQTFRELLRGAARGFVVPALSMWRIVADFVYSRRGPVVEHPANAIVAHAHLCTEDAPAIELAAQLARLTGARLHLVDSYWRVLSDRDEAHQRLASSQHALRGRGVDATVHLLGGDAVDALIDVAQQVAASLIVIDPKASSAVMPWRPHSMTDRVCARAPCNVLIARSA